MPFFNACFAIIALFISEPALAYISPGPGLTMLGSLFALLGSVVVAFFLVALWPMRLLYKRAKARRAGNPPDSQPPAQP